MASNGQTALHFEGVLEKAGKRFFEGFRRRWFILNGKSLSYYKAPETTENNLLGIIDMTKVKSVVPFKMINNAFQIITSQRTYTFTAATDQLLTEWISVLRQAMQIESFSNKRAQQSIRNSSEDSSGYEVVSRSSRSGSKVSSASSGSVEDDAFGDNLYDQIESNQNAPRGQTMGTYEAVGSIKQDQNHGNPAGSEDTDYELVGGKESSTPKRGQEHQIEAYESFESIRRTDSRGSERTDSMGSYGVIGAPEVPPTNQIPQTFPVIYSTVQKTPPSATANQLSVTRDVGNDDDNSYTEVGSIIRNRSVKAPKASAVKPMELICESDDDEDEAFVDENVELTEDPLPPSVGNSYAVDQIKSLLVEMGELDLTSERSQSEDSSTLTTGSPLITVSCEKAFTELKDFLQQLESN